MGILLVVLSMGWGSKAQAQEATPSEYQIKAAFLFHFAQFVGWPEAALGKRGDPLTYCTLGEDPFHGALDSSLSGKTINERPLRVLHLKRAQDPGGCQVLFLGESEKQSIPAVLSSLRGKPVLTVGETEHFTADGGMIGFCLEDNKMRFEINLDAAEKAGLTISSRLLSLAKQVVLPRGGK